ncbi:MAG TPA: DUF5658 family protein [Candidatus Cloacimonas sp.]|nr:DUF5658 family protein [Candidatus Cloacimonas sp.]HQP32564.1 DUF5658 family protein [Candidatus Cloacimonas sp.]
MFWKVIATLFYSPVFTLILSIIFLLLNILDGHSTYLVLKPDKYQREKNPLARWIFQKLKIPAGIIIFKTVLMTILILSISYYTAWEPLTVNIAMLISDLLFLFVVLHNYHLYFRLSRKIRKNEE